MGSARSAIGSMRSKRARSSATFGSTTLCALYVVKALNASACPAPPSSVESVEDVYLCLQPAAPTATAWRPRWCPRSRPASSRTRAPAPFEGRLTRCEEVEASAALPTAPRAYGFDRVEVRPWPARVALWL